MTDKESTRVVSSRWRSISLLLIGLLAGSLLVETASAHLTTFRHVKQSHFYTKRVANKRFVKANERPWAVVAADGSLVEGSPQRAASKATTCWSSIAT